MTMAEEILGLTSVDVIVPPRIGSLMMRHQEPVADSVFNLGEVLITEAMVGLGPHRGYAMRLGRELKPTLAAAIIDAAIEANHPLMPRIVSRLGELAGAARAEERAAWQAVAATRVAFDEMR